MLPLGTHIYLPHSPLTDTSTDLYKPLPCPRVARVGDLPDVGLLGDFDMLFRVYQDWFHQNTGNYLDSGITEDG